MVIDVAIDTNCYRDFVDGEPGAVSLLRSAARICIPFVVVGELRAGFAVGTHGTENERVFEQFLHRDRVEVMIATMETTRHYASLYRQLRNAGTPIPTNDIWLAAIVIQHELCLLSRDRHFDSLPQIARVESK